MKPKQIKRLWSKVKKTDSCWVWTAGFFPSGYGSISINDRTYKVSRVVYELAHGKFDKKLYVLHRCDNKKCVNPKHLFLGTHRDNMKDMVKKGRQSRGEDGRNKLTIREVLKIRETFKKAGVTKQYLANRFNVSRKLIANIINRIAWKHI